MNDFKIKVRQFLPPYLLISVSLLIVYTFLHWLLILQLGVITLSEETTELFIPMGLPWVPLIIWMRPRLLRLNFNAAGRRDPVFGIIFFSGLAIFASLCIAQIYLKTATGKLTRLDNISEIRQVPATKYYTAHHYYVAKRFARFFTYFSVTNKGNDYNMNIYGDIPVFDRIFPDSNIITKLRDGLNANGLVIINGKLETMTYLKKLPADSISAMRYLNPTLVMPHYGQRGRYGALAVLTRSYKLKDTMPQLKITPVAWLAIKFSKTTRNSLSKDEKNIRYAAFIAQCDTEFKKAQYQNFTYLDRIALDDQPHYLSAIRHAKNVNDPFPTILYPVYDSYANKNGNMLTWLFVVNAAGLLVLLLILSLVRAHIRSDLMNEYLNQAL